MEKMHIRFMKDLRNHYFAQQFDVIYKIATAEKVEIPTLETVIERLKPHRRKLMQMNSVKLKHPLTQSIQDQANTRTEYLSCLRLTLEAKRMSHKSEERIAAESLVFWLSPYKDNIYAKTISRQSRMIEELMNDRKLSAEIQQATSLIGLDELLEAIVDINAKIKSNYLKRLNEKEVYSVNGLAIRDAAYKDLKLLVNLIEVSYNLCSDDELRGQLKELSLMINEGLKEFRTHLRSQTTRKRNKKDIDIAVQELIYESSRNSPQESEMKKLSLVIDSQLNSSTSSISKDFFSSNSNSIKGVDEDSEGEKNDKDIIPLD